MIRRNSKGLLTNPEMSTELGAPSTALRAHEELFAALRQDGGTHKMLDRMQTRAELYELIGYLEYEALDSSIVKTIVPQGMPQQ